MNIAAGLLIITIVLIRAVALNRLPKTAFLVLWAVALFRLLVPVEVPAPVRVSFARFGGVADFVSPAVTAAQVGRGGYMPQVRVFPSIAWVETPYLPIAEGVYRQALGIPFVTIAWVIGMAVFFIFFAALYITNHRRLCFATRIIGNGFIDNWLTQHRHIRPIAVMQSDRITTPLAVGIIKPRIILPKCLNLNDKRLLSHILTHEYYHIRRLDALWKVLLVCAVCVHWFNPLAWVMFIMASRDLELTCDEMVIHRLGTETKKDYAYSLINMAEQRSKFASLYNGFSRNAAKERIESLVKMKRKPIIILALAFVMVAALTIGTLTAFATGEPAEDAADYYDNYETYAYTPEPRVIRQQFLDYRAHYGNDDIVGHLYIPNTAINYLVPQTTDNAFYLTHNIWQQRYAAGWVWLCPSAYLYDLSQNLTLYGHNMRQDKRFHSVRFFLQEDFFFSNRYIYFSTIYADYIFEVFSAYVAHVDTLHALYSNSNFDHRAGGWGYYINEFARRSHFDAGITVTENDHVITLMTCANSPVYYRIVVHGRLVVD